MQESADVTGPRSARPSPAQGPPIDFDISRIQERRQFQALLVCEANALMVLNERGAIHYLSPSAKSIFSVPSNLLGQHLLSYVHRNDLYPVIRGIERLLAHKRQRTSWIFRLLTKRGTWSWYKATATCFSYDRDEEIIALLLQDLTG